MSKIDKLSILGVRSFDNIRSETIQFHTPLTLIVGYNGSGKTTIIECLKYATTGQLPPNSKGGAFIHDPKLCGEKEVLAQVKLSFKDHQNARLVVTRSLQLTVKKTTRSVKTLEGNLLMVKDGERTTMSTRVAELDQMMPQLLGVGEAILDNVIFCHQDESLWPMSEPAVLKKKFDEIFEALKYTKAIDNIKVVRKNQGAELQKHKIMEEQFKIEKDRGERAEKKSIQLSDEIEALRKQSEELNTEMQNALDGARAKHEQAREYQEIIVNLGNKRQQAESRREAVDELKENIEELEESDEWLESTLAQYEETMEMYRLEEETYRGNYRDLQKDLEDCRTQMWEKMAERGQIQADNEAHDRQLKEREELVKNAARKYQVRGFEGELDDELIQTFVERMGKLARDKDRELEKLQQTNEEEAREAQGAVNDLLNQRSTRTQDRVTARQAITSNDRRISGLQNEASAIKIDEGAKAVLDEQERELRDKHRDATESFQHADYDAKSRKENSKLRELEDENSNLNDQLIRNTQMAQDRAQLDLKKKELKDRETRLHTLVDTHRDKLKSIVGDTWNPSSVDRDFSASLKLRNTAVQEARSKRDSTSQDLQQVEYRLSTARNTHKRKLAEMNTCEKAVLNSITTDDGGHLHSVADYLPELQQLEDDRQTLKSDIDNYAHLNEFWTGCLKAAEEKNLCKVCERPFQGSQEKSQTVTKLRKRIAKEAKELLEQEIKEVEVQLNDARAVRSQYETCQRLAEEIKPIEKDIAQADEQRTNLLSQLDEQDAVVRREEEAKMDTEALSKPVSTISRLEGEVTEYSKEVARISSQQSSTGSAYLTLGEIQEKLATCSEGTRSVKNRIAAITRDKDQARNTVNSLELQLRDIATKIMNAGHQIREKMTLLQRIDEFKESNLTQQETIRSVDAELEALAPKLASAQAKLGDVKERGRAKEKAINDDSLKLTETVNQLRRVHNAITAYIDKGGPSMMEHCQNEISDLEKEIARIEGKLAEVTSKANKLKEQVDNSEKTKRNISDNIRYRRNVRALEILHAEIAELESRNAHEDERRLSAEARRLDMRYQKLLADRGPVLGQMRAKDQELQGHIKDWETDYKDAARKYRESHIKVETTKAAIEDLARYGNALDQAIMKYHSMKMEEINRIAGELWQSTYQGTDIDTILIRSDAENATLKRNYNYRVCMVKQDAEMDMRGRCSAGQRVLASIIIRLALAECFGINCGLIALDEPTTNLDVDNIKALAVSLHAIINTRMAQSNFQLIVITHDEEFLKYMKCADFCDNYYRVSRDDKQKSIIEKQNITDIL